MGHHVCLIDADVQGSVRTALQIRHEFTLADLMIENIPLDEVLVRDVRENLDVIIADKTLARAEQALVSMPRREEILSFRLRGLVDYDYVVIDCAPSLSQMHHNVLIYADELIIPISMDYLALAGSVQIFESDKIIRELWEKELRLCRIRPTFVISNKSISREILAAIEQNYARFGQRVLPAIQQDMNLRKAIAEHDTIFDYLNIRDINRIKERHRAAHDYFQVAKTIVGDAYDHAKRTEESFGESRRGVEEVAQGNIARAQS